MKEDILRESNSANATIDATNVNIKKPGNQDYWQPIDFFDYDGKRLGYFVLSKRSKQPWLSWRAIARNGSGELGGEVIYSYPDPDPDLPAGQARYYDVLTTKTLPNLSQVYEQKNVNSGTIVSKKLDNGVYLAFINGGEAGSDYAIVICSGGEPVVWGHHDAALINTTGAPNTITMKSWMNGTTFTVLKLAGY